MACKGFLSTEEKTFYRPSVQRRHIKVLLLTKKGLRSFPSLRIRMSINHIFEFFNLCTEELLKVLCT